MSRWCTIMAPGSFTDDVNEKKKFLLNAHNILFE